MDKILVTIIGALGIVFVYWFFFGKREKAVLVLDSVDILVKGGYFPSIVSIPVNKKTVLNFTRKDSNSCLEEVVISDFKIKQFLPLNKKISIEIIPTKTGEIMFQCGMNMFHGKIIVK
ncbi:cupredoxin domain-containing protein [Patescibacteria group bacterium]|nr:cupredoxin domain-containing protein [Patescibacteria group bacterium]